MTPATARTAILTGTVRHRRDRPRPHHFAYELWHVLLDVDELDTLDQDVGPFAYNRPGLAVFRDTDHLGPVDLPVREKLRRFLAGQGVELPDGPVLLQTSLRVLGYVFNPVSWFWCHDEEGDLALVVAEVNNTFGDTHCYVLDDLAWTGEHRVVARDRKVFHVSPFMAIDDHDYRGRAPLRRHGRTAAPRPHHVVAVACAAADALGHHQDHGCDSLGGAVPLASQGTLPPSAPPTPDGLRRHRCAAP